MSPRPRLQTSALSCFPSVQKLFAAKSRKKKADVRPPPPPSQEMLFEGWLLGRTSTPKLVSFKRYLDLLACLKWPMEMGLEKPSILGVAGVECLL